MVQTLVSTVAVFTSTSIDYLLILMIVFAQTRTRRGVRHVVGGLYLGTAGLVAASLIAAFALHFIPQKWITGLLGLIPVFLGINVALKKNDDAKEAEEVGEKIEKSKADGLFWTLALITIASGGDNLGVYIPYFASLTPPDIVFAIFIFIIASAVLCHMGYALSTAPLLTEPLEKYEHIIVPVVYIALGFFIMLESGTLAKAASLLAA
jgi:cadmium resistance transport/sequestration family protein